MDEDSVLRDVEEGAISQLMALLPTAGRDACTLALKRSNFDFDAAVCDLLVELEDVAAAAVT